MVWEVNLFVERWAQFKHISGRILIRDIRDVKYQRVSDLGQVDKLLIRGGAHIEAYGEHLFQGSHNKRSLHRVAISALLLLGALSIRASALRKRTVNQKVFTESHQIQGADTIVDIVLHQTQCSLDSVPDSHLCGYKPSLVIMLYESGSSIVWYKIQTILHKMHPYSISRKNVTVLTRCVSINRNSRLFSTIRPTVATTNRITVPVEKPATFTGNYLIVLLLKMC